ncbi:MAG: C40 family peptidase [Bauldia sp.]|nr:C40 family peptidase [Bauldia sp.]
MITRAAIVAEAMSWIGTPYRHQASLKGVGCDCLGLVRGVWRALYGDEPEPLVAYTPDWAEARGAETLATAAERHLVPVALAEAREGDVVLLRWRANLPAKHAAILISAERMVHAHQGAAVTPASFTPWWRRRAAFAFSFPGVADKRRGAAEPRPGIVKRRGAAEPRPGIVKRRGAAEPRPGIVKRRKVAEPRQGMQEKT